jgi:hypothetical protein
MDSQYQPLERIGWLTLILVLLVLLWAGIIAIAWLIVTWL